MKIISFVLPCLLVLAGCSTPSQPEAPKPPQIGMANPASVYCQQKGGTLPPSTLIHSFLNWKSLVAIAVGVIVSWLGGRGVTLMGSQPQLVAGLLVGTVLGVALFRGVPVGPLIAAGLVSLIVGKQ